MAVLDRVFAAAYDRVLAPSERRGLAAMRQELVGGLSGTVVEIGAGTGLNLSHYPATVTDLVLCEPSLPMEEHLEARRAHMTVPIDDVTVLEAPGEALPLADDAVDHVVSTLVLCTVDDLDQTLREAARVLRPGGTVALIEHIGDPGPGSRARVQHLVEPVWRIAARGCHLTRDPRPTLARHGFDLSGVHEGRIPGSVSLIERAVVGHAVLMA